MRCPVPVIQLGNVDVAEFSARLNQQPETLWDADREFQKSLAPYRKTRTVYLLMTRGSPYAETRRMAGWEPLNEVFEPLARRVASFYPGPGRVLNAQAALLGPGDDIPEHEDYGPVLEATHRVHLPLETHPDVEFMVEKRPISMEVGKAYELDNMRLHGVRNLSPIRRIHLIVDYYEGL